MNVLSSRPATQRIESLIRNYCRISGYQGEPDYESDITDFLADLRHLCADLKLDYNQLSESARHHFIVERNSTGTADRKLLIEQAAVLGEVMSETSDLTRQAYLEGLWNFVHHILDNLEDPSGR